MVAVIGCSPSSVAGILISTFSRPTGQPCNSAACAMVASVSRASPGPPSIDTLPSNPRLER